MLAELGLEYTHHPIGPRTGETYKPEYLLLNPRHKVPLLQHGDFVLAESAAIIQYLSEAFPTPSGLLVPRDPVGRARLNEWVSLILNEFDGHTLYVIRRHDDLKALYGEAPRAVEAAKEYFLEHLSAVAPRLDERGPYLLGYGVSVADMLLATCLEWAASCGIELPGAAQRYRERVTQRPAYRAARERNVPRPAQ
jgi:glutathione S-transferase